MKIATWNVNSLRVRLPHVLQWLEENKPDVLALQEIKLIDENFPRHEILQAGYEGICSGQKSYNGMAILSREPGSDIIKAIPNFEDEARRVLAMTLNDIRIINLYVPNGESLLSEKFLYKLNWLRELKNFLTQQLAIYSRVVILGDFNIAPEEQDVYDPQRIAGKVLFSDQERSIFQEILQIGFHDAFRLHPQPEKSFSWWDYRNLSAFKHNLGLRIDHILVSDALAKSCKTCFIDKIPRGWDRPSDHTPVVVEIEI